MSRKKPTRRAFLIYKTEHKRIKDYTHEIYSGI